MLSEVSMKKVYKSHNYTSIQLENRELVRAANYENVLIGFYCKVFLDGNRL